MISQEERLDYLIEVLMKEDSKYAALEIPQEYAQKAQLLRSLMNVRPPRPISQEFLKVQDEYLQEAVRSRGICDAEALPSVKLDERIALWQGDITTLKVGAIVNAANSQLRGCFAPCHSCIDNFIHTFAGVQLRLECDALMNAQGYAEPTGKAKITKAYNLPCDYVLHTVGPIIRGDVTEEERKLLASCYHSCLEVAAAHNIESIAFCCISTGVFCFPNQLAAEIAVETVTEFLKKNTSIKKVVFNVFKEEDLKIYEKLLAATPLK